MPLKNGIQKWLNRVRWFPAFAGMTEFDCYSIYINNLFSTTVTDVMPLKNGIHLKITENRNDGSRPSPELTE